MMRFTAAKTIGFLVVEWAAWALCLSLSMSAYAAPRIPPVARILRVARLWQAGDAGQGVRVGIISNGARNDRSLVEQGILPPGIAFPRGYGQGDEGDWMLQVVHDVAPRAQLGFCPGGSARRTVACARTLVTVFHADIVVDDINPQPVFFAPTVKAQGLASLLKRHPGVLFFTGAGNNGGGYYQGSWHPQALTLAGRRDTAQVFGVGPAATPYDGLWVSPRAPAVILLGTNARPASPGGRCVASNPLITLLVTNRQGAVLARTTSRCAALHVRLRNRRARWVHWRVFVLTHASSWPPAFALKLVAIRTGLGVSPLFLTVHTAGGAGNSATFPGLMAVAALDPYSGYHHRYLAEPFANSGPQCLDYRWGPSGLKRLARPACFQQPVFAAPDKTQVAMPAANARGYRWRAFSGDSAAGPAAAGVAALLLADHVPSARIEAVLQRTARFQGTRPGWDPRAGYGLIDAEAAAVRVGLLAPRPHRARPPWRAPFTGRIAFRQDYLLVQAARAGDRDAAQRLRRLAQDGQPLAQSLLGTLYNRGWGVTLDPRAAHAWWTRAARRGVINAIYNLGMTWAIGRGATPNPAMGYALMRAAQQRGLSFPPMRRALRHARTLLSGPARAQAARLARRFAANPARIP